jgi:hypothetical protein
MILDTAEAFNVLEHYGIRVASSKTQSIALHGEDIAIVGRTDDASGRRIWLRSATHSVVRMVPLDAVGAEVLASNFRGHDHRGPSEQERRMLEHLLLRVSTFFEQSGVTEFQLDIRLHDNAYTLIGASMSAPKPVHFKARLDPHAHDRKGEGFHPDPVTTPRRR